jgi:hypothetical protein
MSEDILLAADERIPERPFTDPANSLQDLKNMRQMVQRLIDTYDDPALCDFVPGKNVVCQSDPLGRHFRIYYIRPKQLFARKNLTVVGFFGKKRPGADIRPLIRADRQFEPQLLKHDGLLSLSTVRLPDGDFGNLVLFTDPESKDRWNFSQPHYELVSQISPPYYSVIRLNNGVLPDGLAAPEKLRLTRVRYLDYTGQPHWRAIRNLAQ